MVRLRGEASPSPESNKFNPTDFPTGTDILFFDDISKKWKLGTVYTWSDPVTDSDGKLDGKFWTQDAGMEDLKLSVPPKKIDKIPGLSMKFDINGKKYQVDINKTNVIQNSGEVELTLVNIADKNDLLENINLKTIKNLESVEKFETDIDTRVKKLINDVLAKADARTKDILIELTNLQTKIVEMVDKLGALSEWQDIGQAEAEHIGQSIKTIQTEINTDLTALENTLKNIEKRKAGKDSLADEADGLQTRLDREIKNKTKKNIDDHKTAVENAKIVHDDWKKDKTEWDKKKKAKEDWDKLADKKGKPDPGIPGKEPVEPPKPESIKLPEINKEIDAAFDLFTDLEKSTATLPATDKFKQIIDKVKDIADKQAKREGLGDYKKYDRDTQKEVIAAIFQEVLNREKRNAGEEAEKFDLEAEKNELKNKIKELMARAEAAGVLVVPGLTNEQEAEGWSKDVSNMPVNITEQRQEFIVLQHWNLIRDRMSLVFEAENKKTQKTERSEASKNHEKDYDIPDIVLRDLFADRPKEVRGVLEVIYNEKLKATDEQQTNFENNESVMEAMGKLMDKKPSKDVLDKLRQYGIKNWEQFQDVWKKKMAKKAAGVLHQWGQTDLQSELAKQIGTWDTVKALKWQLGARIATNMALVGGGVALIASTGGLGAGIVAAAAGGAVGGGIRAVLQKLVFGSKTMEDRKKKALEEMYDNKRKEIIKNTLDKKFGHNGSGGLNDDTSVIFSSIMAEAIRAASDEMVKGEAGDFSSTAANALSGDSKRLFIQALKNAREAGLDVSPEQKVSMALALQSLIKRGEIKNDEMVKASDPLVIKMLDGVMAGYSGQLASRENYGVAGTAASIAAGATVGLAFASGTYSNATRGVLGALGGATAGYRFGEGLRSKREVKMASENFLPRFKEVNIQWEKYSVDANSLIGDKLKKFGDEIKNFNRYLKGEADTVAEQNIVALLKDNSQLRKQIENLVYQAYRRGVFARIGVAEMKKHAEEAEKESDIKLKDSTKKLLEKQLDRGIYITAGAIVGAGMAVIAGMGAQEVKAYFTMPDRLNTAGLDTKLAAASVAHDMENLPSRTADISVVDEWHAPAPAAEAMPHHEAGLIEAPNKVTGIVNWRHQIMENMGYKFHGGKIDHALRFHEGAKFILKHHDGTTVVDAKGHALEYTFKKGGSTWDALDHLQNKAKGLIKAGDIPTIKIEGADTGKVEVLDKYQVESHGGGKTHMVEGETVEHTSNGKKLDWSGEKLKNIDPLPDTEKYFGEPQSWSHSDNTVRAADGKVFEVITVYPKGDAIPTLKNTHHYFVHDNHLYNSGGKYIGEQYAGKAPADQTTWSSGGPVADKAGLESMLKGTNPGGPAAETAPQVGVATAEVQNTYGVKANVAEVIPNEIPAGFKGHEAEYKVMQDIKANVVDNLRKEQGFALKDRAGEMNKLLSQVQDILQKNPALFKDDVVSRALDSNVQKPTYERLAILVEQLNGKGMMKISDEQNILLGTKMSDNLEEFKQVINGENYEVTVAKGDGGHAVSLVDSEGRRMVMTDSDRLYNKANVADILKK